MSDSSDGSSALNIKVWFITTSRITILANNSETWLTYLNNWKVFSWQDLWHVCDVIVFNESDKFVMYLCLMNLIIVVKSM